MAALDGRWPPNSLDAVGSCLDAGADVVELDITALADRDYLLVHEPRLEVETSGQGPVCQCWRDAARTLTIKWRGHVTTVPVPQLSDVIQLFLSRPLAATTLQLDLKDVQPHPTDEPLRRLVELVTPLEQRVLVSSNADWQLRRLRALAPWLRLGFDIQFHLDLRAAPTVGGYPHGRGSYGYWDDHPLAAARVWSTTEYLGDRCAVLAGLVPGASVFYISHDLLIQSLDDGFNWTTALHPRGIRLDAWTLDVTDPRAEDRVARLMDAGVDQITTNTPLELRRLLDRPATRSLLPLG